MGRPHCHLFVGRGRKRLVARHRRRPASSGGRVVVPNIVQQLFVVPLNFTRGAIIGSFVMSRMGG